MLVPSASNFQPWNGHTMQPSSTVPPWPRWAPRCGQKASCTCSAAVVVAPDHEVAAEVVAAARGSPAANSSG